MSRLDSYCNGFEPRLLSLWIAKIQTYFYILYIWKAIFLDFNIKEAKICRFCGWITVFCSLFHAFFTERRGVRSEGRGMREEVRGQRAEWWGMRSEVRVMSDEVRGQSDEGWSQKSELWVTRSEGRGRRWCGGLDIGGAGGIMWRDGNLTRLRLWIAVGCLAQPTVDSWIIHKICKDFSCCGGIEKSLQILCIGWYDSGGCCKIR